MILSLKQEFERLFKSQLPGKQAQSLMSPLKRSVIAEYENNYPQTGAVLILIYKQETEFQTVVMLRPEYDGPHSGQVSFPGGKHELTDLSLQNTALREASEELGVYVNDVDVLGKLTELYIPISNFMVHPFLALVESKPLIRPNPKEVSRVIEINLAQLLDEKNIKRKPIMIKLLGKEVDTPYFDIEGATIWGATAMILSELREMLKQTTITFS